MQPTDLKKVECNCNACVRLCAHGSPGWFLPGEAEKAAELLGMSLEEFKAQYLIVDYWTGYTDIDVLTPAKDIELERYPMKRTYSGAWERGRCVFLDENERCKIHAAKPYECAVCDCKNKEQSAGAAIREMIKEQWRGKDV